MLAVYSSEINFMPNYIERPDKWHLIIPMFGFTIIAIGELIWSIIHLVKYKNKAWDAIIIIVLSFICFANLNNPKGNFQEGGYKGLIVITITSIIITIIANKNNKRV